VRLRLFLPPLASFLAACLCAVFAPRAEAQASPADSAAATMVAIRVCVLEAGGPRWEAGVFRPAHRDTVVVVGADSLPGRDAPGAIHRFAAGRSWYEEGRPIVLLRPDSRPPPEPLGRPYRAEYIKAGPPHLLFPSPPGQAGVVAFGTYDGVPLFGEDGPVRPAEVYLVPVAPGCVFQAYMPAVMY
jgi:hypothetical protein